MVPNKVILITALFFFSAAAAPFSWVESVVKTVAPLLSSLDAEVIPNEYIVVFKNEIHHSKIEEHHNCVQDFLTEEKAYLEKRGFMDNLISGIKHTYNIGNLRGYAGRFSDEVLQKIRESDEVAYVEKDQTVYANELQKNAPWGLSRVSHRQSLTLRTYNKYPYHEAGGEGVTVYIIDTGININHVDFEGRAIWGETIPDGDDDVDGNGHGTHVAGTVAGKSSGVSKNAKVVAVKVLRSNGSGTMSDVVKGVEWAADKHKNALQEARNKNKQFKGSAANMSLGGGKSRALDAVVNAAVDAGLHFAVAAGNDNRDACDYSPAAAEKAVTVGASTFEDERAWFSNYGKCVDVFAPGKDIKSAWTDSNTSYKTISGTSMASPHVAGLLAYFLSLYPDTQSEFFVDPPSPKIIKEQVISLSTSGVLDKIPSDTPNLLVFNNYDTTGTMLTI